MTKTSQLTALIIIFILTLQICGCKTSRTLSSMGQIVTDRVLFIPVASAAILKQAATKVYEMDSLKAQTPAQLKELHMTFYNQRDTLNFNFDNVGFHFDGGSLKFDEFTFPKWDIQKVTDRMHCRIHYLFTTPARSSPACIEGFFNVMKGIPTPDEPLQLCR